MTIRFTHILIGLLLLSTLCLNKASFSAEQHPASSTINKPIQYTRDDAIVIPKNQDWMQDMYSTISDSVYQSAFWFDTFFINDDSDRRNPKTTARIRLGWEPRRGKLDEIDTRFRIKVKLPHFKSTTDLILSDDSEDELSRLPLENESLEPENKDESFAAALRFVHISDAKQFNDTRIGISGGDVFLKSRYIKRYAWQDVHGFKFEPSLFYYIGDGLGARVLMEYDYQLSERSQLRVDYSVRGSASFSGIRWKHGIYHLNQLDQHKATALGLLIQGERNGRDGFFIDKYMLNYRYRFNAMKKWLFFDIEPFIEWRKDDNFEANPGIAFRVEGYFSKG